MNNIISIAKNTFKETIRDKILYGIFSFALLFLIGTTLFGSISLGEDVKVVKDLGLAGIYIFSLIITIFLGSSLVYREIEKRTLFIILSKPVSVTQFVLGKFFGLWSSVSLNVLLMTIVYLIVVYIKSNSFDFPALLANLLLIFELGIFVAVTIIFSTFTTPLASTIYSIIILYVGHSMSILKQFSAKGSLLTRYLLDFIYYVFPNLEKFNIRNEVVHGLLPNSAEIIYPIVYAFLLGGILLYLSILTLKHQEL